MRNFIEPITLHVGTRHDVESVSPGRATIVLARMYARSDLPRWSGTRYSTIERFITMVIREASLQFKIGDFDDVHNLDWLHRVACQAHNATASTAIRHALRRPAFYFGGKGVANEVFVDHRIEWMGKMYRCTSFRKNERLGHYIVAVPVERTEGDPLIIRITHKEFVKAEKERKATGESRGRVRR